MAYVVATLTIQVVIEENGENPANIRSRLHQIADHAYSSGMVTGDGPAEVTEYNHGVVVSRLWSSAGAISTSTLPASDGSSGG